jgi:hypothetical protein
LFLHHILRFHLAASQVQEAVSFASHYQHLVFFAHALEILLHTVVESEATGGEDSTTNTEGSHLPSVIEFLDHFDVALDVVVGCARKTEVTHWRRLFDIVGDPKALFEVCVFTPCCAPRRAALSLYKLNILFFFNADMPKLAATADSRFIPPRLT